MIGVILPIGHNDMIHKVDAHEFTSPLDGLRQLIVSTTGTQAPRRMVMTDGQDGGVGEDSLADDDSDIDSRFRDATM